MNLHFRLFPSVGRLLSFLIPLALTVASYAGGSWSWNGTPPGPSTGASSAQISNFNLSFNLTVSGGQLVRINPSSSLLTRGYQGVFRFTADSRGAIVVLPPLRVTYNGVLSIPTTHRVEFTGVGVYRVDSAGNPYNPPSSPSSVNGYGSQYVWGGGSSRHGGITPYGNGSSYNQPIEEIRFFVPPSGTATLTVASSLSQPNPSSSRTAQITIENLPSGNSFVQVIDPPARPPSVDIQAQGGTTISVGQTVRFTSTASDQDSNLRFHNLNILRVGNVWNFQTGWDGSAVIVNGAQTQSVSGASSIRDNTIRFDRVGTYTVMYSVSDSLGTGGWPESNRVTVVVTLPSQSINFPEIAPLTFGAPPFVLGASATSGLPVSFNLVSGSEVVSIVGNTVNILRAGTAVIRASQAGDSSWAPAASIDRTITVNPATIPVVLSDLVHTYDGSPKPAKASIVIP